ncbi:MAG: AAA family ATPase [Actinomycetota bacterium]|nr:AAA family ATPase [Actinomycetota bacterium]
MRIRRISLRNFRGVVDSTVELATEGVTVIEGPNEAGKSSIADAIDFILNERDSSTRAPLREMKPLDADEGAEVELELVTGPYHAVYSKRWHKRPKTELTVLRPVPENLTGRLAHERMEAILAETLDKSLWSALRLQQGVTIAQAAVGESLSLAAALDAAASGAALGGADEARLWDRVQEEWREHFTAGGREVVNRKTLAKKVADAAERVEQLQAELDHLDDTAERHRRLGFELANIDRDLAEQRKTVGKLAEECRRLAETASEVKSLQLAASEANRLVGEARAASERRKRLLGDLKESQEALSELRASEERETAALQEAVRLDEDATRRRDEARHECQSGEEALRAASGDCDYFRNLEELEQLGKRRERVARAEQRSRDAESVLAGCPIGPAKLAEIEEAYVAAAEARARLAGQSPLVRVEAISGTDVVVGDVGHSLSVGQVVERRATADLEVLIPDLVRVTVTGGGTAADLAEESESAQRRLDELCRAVGVSGSDAVGAARSMERRRREAELEARMAARDLAEDLGQSTSQFLSDRIERLRQAVSDDEEGRGTADGLPSNAEEADVRRQAAAARLQDARDLLDTWQREAESRHQALSALQKGAIRRRAMIEMTEQALSAAERALAADRAARGDDELSNELEHLEACAGAAEHAHSQASAALEAEDPERAELLHENAVQALARTEQRASEVDREMERLATELEVRGSDGIHAQLDWAKSELAAAEQEQERTERRAAAAGLLYETMRAHREDATRSRMSPFRDQIVSLGRIVFDDSFSVELDENLQIVSRTHQGVTVPYKLLSTGTKEQLCILSRLACATLVNPATPGCHDVGVPVILDDALGYSDPVRLERLNAALAVAARQSQVIVLTCTPGRYRDIGPAKVVRLERQRRNSPTWGMTG